MAPSNNSLPTAESVKSFCGALSINPTTFYKHVNLGNIKIVKVGKKTIIPTSERQEFLDRLSGTMKTSAVSAPVTSVIPPAESAPDSATSSRGPGRPRKAS